MPYTLYVIELDPAVRTKKRFMAANPGYRADKPCVYVGSTWLTPGARFAQHKSGIKATRYARDFGIKLKPRLYAYYRDIPTRKAAEEAEELLAQRLRRRGYAVWCGI